MEEIFSERERRDAPRALFAAASLVRLALFAMTDADAHADVHAHAHARAHAPAPVSYTPLPAHETEADGLCRLLH